MNEKGKKLIYMMSRIHISLRFNALTVYVDFNGKNDNNKLQVLFPPYKSHVIYISVKIIGKL